MQTQQGIRGVLKSPYHYCARCGCKRRISELKWQRGLFLCRTGDCNTDTLLVGQREAMIAGQFQGYQTEAEPDPKLQNPDLSSNTSEFDIML